MRRSDVPLRTASPRRRAMCMMLGAALVALATLGCGASDSTTPPPPPGTPPGSTFGTVNVSVTTTGASLDGDGYTVKLGAQELAVPASGSVQFTNVSAGSYALTITGLAFNCTSTSPPPANTVVTAGSTVNVALSIRCQYDISGATLPQLACANLVPATTHVLPGSEVSIGAVPSGLEEPLYGMISWAGGDEAIMAYVDVESASVVIPFHPNGSMAGGDVLVRIGSESVACAPFTITVDPLTPAPGEFAAVVDLMQQLIDAQAALVGETRAGLMQASIPDLPLYLVPLAVSQSLVESPEHPNSLRGILAGTAPDAQGLNIAFFDALLARTTLRADMQAALANTAGVEPSSASRTSRRAASTTAAAPIFNALDCMFDRIQDAASLERCMTLGRDKIPGPAGTAARSMLSNYLHAAATVPVLKPLMAAASELLWAMGTYDDILASNLPTEFVSLTVHRDSLFDEDQEGLGTWAPAMVMATSTGWRFDRLFFETMVRSVKATPTYRAWMQRAGRQIGSWLANGGSQAVIDSALTEAFSRFITTAMSAMFNLSGGADALTIPPKLVGPIDISLEEFTTSRIVVGDAVRKHTHRTYEPRNWGVSQLEVITKEGKFGNTSIVTDPFIRVEVKRIALKFEPIESFLPPVTEFYVAAGDTVDVLLTVEHSQHPDSVELVSLAPGKGTVTLTRGVNSSTDGRTWHAVRYIAPSSVSALPAVIGAIHTSTSGARRFTGDSPRSASFVIRPKLLTISPATGCVDLSGTRQFTATVFGDTLRAVRWSTDVGTIHADSGLYRAPSAAPPGTIATISAVSVEDSTVRAEVEIGIGCACLSVMTVGSVTVTAQSGEVVSFGDWGGPNQPYGNNFELFNVRFSRGGGGSTYTLPLDDNPATWPAVGNTPVRVQGSVGLSSPQILYSSNDEMPAIMHIEEYVPEQRVVGSVHAEVIILSGQNPFKVPASFSWRFAVTVPPGTNRGGPGSQGYRFSCTVP